MTLEQAVQRLDELALSVRKLSERVDALERELGQRTFVDTTVLSAVASAHAAIRKAQRDALVNRPAP